jgi:hypothetical protein
MRISIYKNIKSIAPLKDTSVLKVLDAIQRGTYKKQIASVRIESEKSERNKLKSQLPYVTFCGTFSSRSNSNLRNHSGLACLDFDNVNNLEELREQINQDPYTFSSFVSPSGDGLKVLVKIPSVDNNNDYQDYYHELVNHYKKYYELDEGTKDLARACYLSYDADLFLNNESDTFTDKFNRPLPIETNVINIPITDQNVIAERLEKWFTKRWTTTNRNNNLHAYARQMNAFGIDKATCENYLLRYNSGGKENEISKLIGSAYKYTDEFNTRSFEDTKRIKEIKHIAIAGENIEKLKQKITDIDFEKVKAEFNQHKQELKHDEFWYYTESDQIKLSSYRFLQYLEHNSIFKYYPNENNDAFHFVKNDKNFISLFETPKIKDFVLADLRTRGLIDAWELMANTTSYFDSKFLSMVNSIDVSFNRDTQDTSYVYYENAVVKTTKDEIEVLNYSDINDLIWKNQVIKRDIQLNDKSNGIFKTFIWKVSGENIERYYTLKSVIGYLMHSYQNEAKPKAIIFNDEMISEDIPNGGSGKGLIHKAIGHIKNIVTEDGKKFDSQNQFAYQKVNKDTQIFLMDDVPKHFKFESLFSIITEGMTIEKKGQDAYQIPFKESPKISITTNYTINGSGASHERRIFEVEIANYFNDNLTPEMEFGHLFFSDWDEKEWANFDNFMIRCVQYFLKNGLVQSDKVNLKFRKFKNEMGAEFIEFMESKKLDGSGVNRKEFRDDFNRQYPTLARFNTAQKFNKKVKDYCSFNEIEFKEGKFNGVINFYIGGDSEETNDVPF